MLRKYEKHLPANNSLKYLINLHLYLYYSKTTKNFTMKKFINSQRKLVMIVLPKLQ